MTISTKVDLKINKMTKAQYEAITPNPNEIYIIVDDLGITSQDIIEALGYTPYNASNPDGFIKTVNDTYPDREGNVELYIPDEVTEATVSNWGFTKNIGTVTSVNGELPDREGEINITIPDVSGKEDVSNKVTSISAQSTNTQYPSAKCVYDIVGDIETALNTINSGTTNSGSGSGQGSNEGDNTGGGDVGARDDEDIGGENEPNHSDE